MADVLTPEQRRRCMAAIRSKNTGPELTVRKLLTSLGYRYRLHSKTLPGQPDIVIKSLCTLIFVHGCFWHLHSCKYGRVVPKTNADFWQTKRLGNLRRDRRTRRRLQTMGWKVLVVWECQTTNPDILAKRLARFFTKG